MRKSKFLIKATTLISLSAITFLGCGGGGGGGGTTAPTSSVSTITGLIKDGPIENARVFIDENLNGVYDSGEPYDMSDKSGKYEITHILDPQKSYLIVAQGDKTLNTKDDEDNLGADLNFIMFGEVKSNVSGSGTNIIGQVHPLDITPLTFQNYLLDLNSKLYGSLETNSSNPIYEIIKAPKATTEQNQTSLFKEYILSSSKPANLTLIQEKLKQITPLIEEKNSDLVVSSNSEISSFTSTKVAFSDKNISELSKSLVYENKTTPAVVGGVVISKPLLAPKKVDDNYIFVTKYDEVLEIPEYKQITELGYSVVSGADLKVKKEGSLVKEDSNLSKEAIKDYTFPSTSEKYDLLQFNGSSWEVSLSNVNADEIKESTISLEPFVLVKKAIINKETFTVDNYDLIKGNTDTASSEPVVVVKGRYESTSQNGSSLMSGTSITLDVAKVSKDGKVELNVPDGFIIEEMVVVSQNLVNLTPEKKPSVSFDVKDGKVEQNISSITPLTIINDEQNKTLILDGNLLQESVGIDSMIDTHLLYSNLKISLNLINDESAKNILMTNINSFLSSNPSFYGSSQTIGDITIDATAQSIKLNKKSTDESLDVTWKFSSKGVERTLAHTYSQGDKQGSSQNSTYTFEYKNAYNGVSAQFKDIKVDKNLIPNYSDSLETTHEGTAIFQRDENDAITKLLSSKYTQLHTQESSKSGKSFLNGVIQTADINSSNDPLDNSLSFDGDFGLYTNKNTYLEGTIKVNATDANTTNGIKNQNSINKAILITKPFSAIKPNEVYTGYWVGSYTNSCDETDGNLLVEFENEPSWWSVDANGTYYGTTLKIENNTTNLYENSTLWGSVKFKDNSLSGTWKYGKCDGNITLSKQ